MKANGDEYCRAGEERRQASADECRAEETGDERAHDCSPEAVLSRAVDRARLALSRPSVISSRIAAARLAALAARQFFFTFSITSSINRERLSGDRKLS
jgi:hypothetical protein